MKFVLLSEEAVESGPQFVNVAKILTFLTKLVMFIAE